ncbi:MAG TPA: phage portal protein [Ktedonobacteraceae bacterium]|jgi:HK97 family phage portal protein|nr:phage portal protein [Ktedonobacteraceae bacterium]
MGIWNRLSLALKAITDPRAVDPNYGTSLQIITPGQPVWTPKNYANFVKEGYRRTSAVYSSINKISSAAAGISWKLYEDRTMKTEIEEHPLLDLWRKPNLNESSGAFVEKLFGFWHLAGNSYIWAFRPSKNGPPLALWHLRPDRVKIVPSSVGIENYVYGYGTPGVKLYEPEDIMHIKFPAYDDDYYGLSPIETASQLIDQQNEGNAWNTALMQNMGKPSSGFFAKGFLTVEARNQIRDELRRKYSGKRNAGTPLVLEGDMTWQNMSLSPYELDWMQSRELNTREIAAILDVAPELIGDSAGKTFANVSEARAALYTENVLPKIDRVRDHVNSWLVPMYEDLRNKKAFFTYDKEDIEALAEMYQSQLTAKSERFTNLWNSMQCTLDEAREGQGLEKLPNGKGNIFKIMGTVTVVSADELDVLADKTTAPPEIPPPTDPSLLPQGNTTVQELPPAGGTTASANQKNPHAPNGKQPPVPSGNEKPASGKGMQRKATQDANYKVWHCMSGACEFCLENNSAMVGIDDDFPNGCAEPDNCHKYCQCSMTTLSIPDETDLSGLSIAAMVSAFAVDFIESRHDRDVAARQAQEDKLRRRSYDRSYQKALTVFTVDERYLQLRAMSAKETSRTQERYDGLPSEAAMQEKKTPGTAIVADTSPFHSQKDRRRRRSDYQSFIERYM